MATSKSDETQSEKPKSSPARKLVLLLLLIATMVVVGLDYLPEDDSETKVVGPAKKARPAAQAPAQPQNQQPTAPQQRTPQQPKVAPAPTPPVYERPPTTLFVSGSPSDAQVPATSPTETAVAQTATVPTPEVAPSAEMPTAPAPTDSMATEAAPAAETAPTTPAPVAEAAVATETPVTPAEPGDAPAELLAARSPVPLTAPGQNEPELGIVVDKTESTPQTVARPLPEGSVPAKVDRYAQRLFDRYDTNRDGVIDATERRQMEGNPATIDYNADGEISLKELAAYAADFGRHRRMRLTGTMVEDAVAELPPLYIPTAERDAMAAAQAAAQQAAAQQAPTQQAAQQAHAVPVALVDETAETDAEPADDAEAEESDEPEATDEASRPMQPQPAAVQAGSKRFVTPKSRLAGLPEWFLAQDDNGDGQIAVAEYAPNSEKARLADFARYDRNHDGVLTAEECPKK